VSEFTQVLKATPLLAMITVVEMMRVSQQIFSANYHPVEVLSGAFVLYFLICFAVSRSSIGLERRFAVRRF
jgi:polar amino acid transport system permease protein